MNRKLDLKVGQKVTVKIEPMSNASRYVDMSLENIDDWCFEGEVTKVTNKYITVKFKCDEEKFSVEDDYRQKTIYGGADYKLYLNRQEVIDEKEANDIYYFIRYKFDGYGCNNNKFTLNQLRRIRDIIKEGEK